MGNCCGTEEQKRTNKLNKDLKKKQQQEGKVKKLLLLGAGGSGKSTFFKQLRMLHGTPIGATEMENTYKDIVFSNVITGMKTLVENCKILSETLPKCKITEANQDFADFIENFEEDLFAEERLNVRQAIQQLWADPGVQLTWRKHRSKFQVEDSARHFFESIERITESSYCPNDEDVLLARIRTTGIVEQELKIKGNVFQIFDVGGQRNERKKWIHCFENVTGVLFLVSLSAYDQTLYEDDTTNRMKEALGLFKNICNSRWFKDAAMILFLNKKDLFQEKNCRSSNKCLLSRISG